MSGVTRLLEVLKEGDPKASEELLPLVYAELRKVAAWQMAKEAPGNTLQPTALVHEAWLRLVDGGDARWDGRRHFFAAAAETMRRILVDRARRRLAIKRGGEQHRTEFEDLQVAVEMPDERILALHEALDALAAHDARKAELVKLRYFGGMTLEEAADLLQISERTAKRDWTYSRAWLYRRITTG